MTSVDHDTDARNRASLRAISRAIALHALRDFLVGRPAYRIDGARWIASKRSEQVCREAGIDRSVLLRVCREAITMTDTERKGLWTRVQSEVGA